MLQVALSMPRAKGMAGTYFTIQLLRDSFPRASLPSPSGHPGFQGLVAFLEARWIPTLAAAAFTVALMVFITRKSPPGADTRGLTGEMLAFSLPLIPANLALLVLSSADMFMLRTISPDLNQSGWYEWAGRAVLVLTPLTLGFGMAWQRYIFRKRKQGEAWTNLAAVPFSSW